MIVLFFFICVCFSLYCVFFIICVRLWMLFIVVVKFFSSSYRFDESFTVMFCKVFLNLMFCF